MPFVRQAPIHELPVRFVKGVGPARAEQLVRLEIRSVEDLLLAVPRRHEDRSRLVAIRDLVPEQSATVRARVLTKNLRRIPGRRPIVEASLSDETGVVRCVWFNQPYLATMLDVGHELIAHGKVELARRLELVNPEIERIEDDSTEPLLHAGRIIPIYPLTSGVTQRWFRKIVNAALNAYAAAMPELLPASVRQRHQLPGILEALRQVHFPESFERLEQARRRLAFEELFGMQLRLAMRRARFASRRKPQRYLTDAGLSRGLLERLPFSLTDGQRRAWEEIVADLAKPSPMLRLLQGDVGCGKTVVAALVMAVAVQSGYQVAVMAPTELLAQQHARVLADYLEPLGVRVGLLVQGIKPEARTTLLRELATGRLHVLIGTHALIEDSVVFHRLSLAVIDEQHKFGVSQRAALVRKAAMPDVLAMTATPIPRTLALSIYGDLACSTIAELPPGRTPVRTRWYTEAHREQAYDAIRKELQSGRQGYVVYPLVNANDRQELKDATQMAKRLQRETFPEFSVGLLHGQMKSADQAAAMRAFLAGEIQLLVSTVIVEVGLDVPNATLMLIEHPERFGLSQLHQLRGRIGRGAAPGTCVLISDPEDETARKRLSFFARTTDGFRLAEFDLELRGPGELLGRQQHGWWRFRVADLVRDQALLGVARQDAFRIVEADPRLADPQWAPLIARLRAASAPPKPQA